MALPVPDFGDPSQTREMAGRSRVHDDDQVRLSALIWLSAIGLVVVLALMLRAVVA
jgi:hypothetical protein